MAVVVTVTVGWRDVVALPGDVDDGASCVNHDGFGDCGTTGRRPSVARNETLRALFEMRYPWREPVRMANRRLVGFLGAEPHTPLEVAVERTLEGMGCLPRAAGGGTVGALPR